MKIEICLDSVASARAAEAGGADRLELCDNLFEGGTTPSAGMIRAVRERASIGVQVIIRPRGGDFCYSEDEFAVMAIDIGVAKELGADGVVFGILNPDGTVDAERCARLRELASPMNATFHRAFDVTPDAAGALEEIIALGFDRILTSGQTSSVWEGIDLIGELVKSAGERIIIMPGGGLHEGNVARCMRQSAAREFHISVDRDLPGTATFRRDVPMGGALRLPEHTLRVTDATRVAAVRALAGGDGGSARG